MLKVHKKTARLFIFGIFLNCYLINPFTSISAENLETLSNMGWKQFKMKNYQGAIDIWQKGLKKAKWNKMAVANFSEDIGLAYYRLGNIPKTLEYYQRTLKSYKHFRKWGWITRPYGYAMGGVTGKPLKDIALNKIGILLTQIARVYHFRLKDYPKALEYYQQVLKIAREIGKSNYEETMALKKIGNLYKIMGNDSKAKEYLKQSEELETEENEGASE